MSLNKPSLPFRSLCTFLRASMNLKGNTTHNGAGAYIMEVSCSWDEFVFALTSKIDKERWENMFITDQLSIEDDCIRITFDEDKFGGYNNLFAHKSQFTKEGTGNISVHMDIF